jgi:uncharacterized RDD family membrane protein YckC
MTYPPTGDPYGNPQPQYGDAPPPPPPYGTPPQYGASQPAYGTPPQYGASQPAYGTPPQYGAPQPPYGTAPGYQMPYGAPVLQYASWIQRVGAYLLDALLFVPFYIVALVVARTLENIAGILILLVVYLVAAVVVIYNRSFQGGRTGQSWGKKVVGLRLVSEVTGQPIGAGMAFARDIAHVFDAVVCYVGFLFPLWDAKRQTLSDKIVKTVVIK